MRWHDRKREALRDANLALHEAGERERREFKVDILTIVMTVVVAWAFATCVASF